jgi:hypothetical protein
MEYWVVIADVDGRGNIENNRVTEVELVPGWHCLEVAWRDQSSGDGGGMGIGIQGPFGGEHPKWGFRPVGLEEDLEEGWQAGMEGTKRAEDEICFEAQAGHRYKIEHKKDQRGWFRSVRTKHWFWIVDTLGDSVVGGTRPEEYQKEEA